MPNYEFRCQSCDKQFIKSMTFGSKELPECPVCKGKTQRIIVPPMVHFKGSGFYKTDSTKAPVTEKAPVQEAPKVAETPKPPEKPLSPSPKAP